MLNAQIIQAIERVAPLSLQESWDNSGVQVGRLDVECTGVLICFDVTPAVVEEAISLNYNLIISHHPLLFHGLKQITGSTPQQACVMNAIAAGITIYSSHTAIDSAIGGVSYTLAKLLGVTPLRVLDPLADRLIKLQVTVPDSHVEVVRAALFDAGAGSVGNYDCCSFNVNGYGTFRAIDGAAPFVGEIGENHTETETEISVVLPRQLMSKAERMLLEVHPYETPAYQFVPLLNRLHYLGIGIYGTTDSNLSPVQFIDHLKKVLNAQCVRTSALPAHSDMRISRVALCGGAGHQYIDTAIAMGAQIFITAELKYNEFVDYQDRIILVDAGHYETEAPIKQVLFDLVKAACPGFDAIACTRHEDNPVHYI